MKLVEGKFTIAIKFHILTTVCTVALLTGLCFGAHAAPPSIHAEIDRLQRLSESHPDQAIKQVDELLKQLPLDAPATDRRDLLLLQIPLEILKGNKDHAKKLIESLRVFGDQYLDQTARVMAMNYQSKLLGDEGKYGEGLTTIEQAFAITKLSNDGLLINQVETTAGGLYSSIGNFQAALQHQLNALEALDAIKNSTWKSELLRAKTLNNIARLYLSLKDDDTTLSYLAKAKSAALPLDAPAVMSSIDNNTGYANADLAHWKQAIVAYEDSLNIARKVGDREAEAKSLNNLADASLNQGDYASCLRFATQSIAIARTDGLINTEMVARSNLGVCYMHSGEIAKGVANVKESLEIARKSNAIPATEGMLADLSNAYEQVGMYQEALKTLKDKDQITNELFRVSRDRAMVEMKVHFDLNERQKEIEKLEQKNAMQRVEIENKNLQRIISILTIVVAVAASIAVFFLYRKVRRSNQRLRAANLKLRDQSTRDPLTGLLNRRAFQQFMETFKIGKDQRRATPPGFNDVLILLDIDHFKYINDNYGHPIGDVVLIEIGRRLQRILREKDMLIRWGGEEFLIYLHQVPAEKVAQIIERELAVISDTPVSPNDANASIIPITISGGYILMPLPGIGATELSWESALQLIDIALYKAKSGGRNQAIGIESVNGTSEQIAALVSGDLQSAVDSGIFSLRMIAGVAREKDLKPRQALPDRKVT